MKNGGAHSAILGHMEQVLLRSQLEIDVLDANGVRLISRNLRGEVDADFLRMSWESGVEANVFAGMAYLRLDLPPVFALSSPIPRDGGVPGQLYLAAALLQALMQAEMTVPSQSEVYSMALSDHPDQVAIEACAMDFDIPCEAERCVMLFHVLTDSTEVVTRVLQTLFTPQSGDAVLPIDRHTVALCKSMDDSVAFEDMEQLARAVDDTVMSETGLQILIGVGEPRRYLYQLGESLHEARQAINIGRLYRPDERLFLFRRLLLERLLCEVPAEVAGRYHQALFGKRQQRFTSEEMLNTIDKFFACSLNLSEAARQLYIHRNTLVYRLDKFQKATGLDLRKFEDAVTFRIMMLLGRGHDAKRAK